MTSSSSPRGVLVLLSALLLEVCGGGAADPAFVTRSRNIRTPTLSSRSCLRVPVVTMAPLPSPLHSLQSQRDAFGAIPLFLSKDGPEDALEKKVEGKNESSSSGVKLGSAEYYEGFVSRDVTDDDPSRVTGDAVLGPTLKLAGGAAAFLAACFFVFLVSNGLI